MSDHISDFLDNKDKREFGVWGLGLFGAVFLSAGTLPFI
jgi:hypothetical protein